MNIRVIAKRQETAFWVIELPKQNKVIKKSKDKDKS